MLAGLIGELTATLVGMDGGMTVSTSVSAAPDAYVESPP